MIDNNMYRTIETIAASDEIASYASRVQTLNVLKGKLEALLLQTTSNNIKRIIGTDLTVIQDCYIVDMYKFQLRGLSDMLQKDIKNIQEAIALEIP